MPTLKALGEGLHPEHKGALWQFGWSTLLKLFLTEGEKLLLLLLFTESQWGVFGLVSNFGSLILRLLFAPTEEIALAAFAAEAAKPREQWTLLRALLMLQGGVGWLGLCFGPSFSGVVVRVLYGEAWAVGEAPTALGAYCVLLFVLALNGILDAYFNAAAPPQWLSKMRYIAIASSAVLVASAFLLQGAGSIALVWANSAATALRVLACAFFVREHMGLTVEDLGLQPVARLFGMIALAGMLNALLLHACVGDISSGPVPWKSVIGCILAAGSSVVAVAWLCRGDLRALWRSVRDDKYVCLVVKIRQKGLVSFHQG